MKLLKPAWVHHNGKPIFSVDIHPDGTKFATGGQGEDSGKVVIWNMPPVVREEDEKNEAIPKMLCQMDNHLACVNCVRWSNNGLYLASGGDDKLIMLWKRAAYIGPSNVFGSSSKLANVEQWRCVSILRSHTGDVMDLAWSPHDAWLSSCSIDNTVVIWNALKFPEIIATLRGHSGLVKGLTWDPVGKYIASQADDRSLKVWRTMDWQLETNITKPFDECAGTTHVLRLSWSPDGHYLVSAHAMNNSGPTAQIIERDGWKTNMDFVGHRKAVTVVKFNPKIFKKKPRNGSSNKPSCPYCCCAVGSKDRSLSVWLTCLKRPLVVIHELFDKSIMDISWTLTGLGLLVCSMDGTVAFLDFSQEELGDPLTEEEKNMIHQKTYGKSLAITTEQQLSTTIIENPEMLKYQQQQKQLQEQKNALGSRELMATKVPNMLNGESLEDIRKNLLKKQIETRTADGRRRITPFCIAQLDTGDFSTAFFNSVPITGALPGSVLSSQISQPQPSSDSNAAKSVSTKLSQDPAPAIAKPPEDSPIKDGSAITSTPTAVPTSTQLLTSPSRIEPMKALDSRFTERSKSTPGTAPISSVARQTDLDRGKDLGLSKELKPREIQESSSDSDEKIPASKISSSSKRKYDTEAEVVEKKKKGRPRKETKHMPITITTQPAPSTEKEVSRVSAPVIVFKLPTPTPKKAFNIQVSTEPAMYIEVENEVPTVTGWKLSRLKCMREGKEWDTLLTSRILTAAGSCDLVSVACEERMVSVFSANGRRLLPAILLQSPISTLHCASHFVMALMATATLSVWDAKKQTVLVKDESLITILSGNDTTITQSLLTHHGVPVVTLSNGKSYCFNTSLCTWNLISDKQDSLVQCADYRSCLTSQEAMLCSGPLATVQGCGINAGRQAARLSSMPHVLQRGTTLAYLENQVAAAMTLKSSQEYRHWLLIYTRYLVNEGFEPRLRELCKDLLGPVHNSSSSQWESTVLGLRKRELLKEMLPVIGQNLRFQRLFTEYQDQLDLLRDK